MPRYLRAFEPGAKYFFTVVTLGRRPILKEPDVIGVLREAFRRECEHHAFEIDAIVVLPDHVHTIWTLPEGDMRFSMRWSGIKGAFTRRFLELGGTESWRSASRLRREERGVWQRRFWEHMIRDEDDYARHMDYIHYNPVKHGYASCPHTWPHSSFSKWIKEGVYDRQWLCCCGDRSPKVPCFEDLANRVGE